MIDVTDPDHDRVVAIPQPLLAQGGDIQPPGLPFALRVKTYFPNSPPAGPMSGGGEKLKAGNGIGQRLLFTAAARASRMDDENRPAALIEVVAGKGRSLGDWTVSSWLTKPPLVQAFAGGNSAGFWAPLTEPQTFLGGAHL